jgi:hypothetical protein
MSFSSLDLLHYRPLRSGVFPFFISTAQRESGRLYFLPDAPASSPAHEAIVPNRAAVA